MTNAVPILAALVAAAAAVVRAPRWPNTQSRPLTLGLALLAVWAVMRTPVIHRAAEDFAATTLHYERLPELLAQVASISAAALLTVTVAQAWARPTLIKAIYVTLAVVLAAVLVTYDPVESPDHLINARKWLIAGAMLVSSIATIVAATLSLRELPARYRLPMMLFLAGGVLAMIASIARGAVLLMPDVRLGDWWAVLASLPIFAYAIGSLIASARTRNMAAEQETDVDLDA
ncbi:hypothetical protein AB0N05_14835 [Nocardia sp. NPDC051030]|uniref:hypothetical protein n=1 Tax=Nocardia sp. NPDC051030 TaxID=3155162 RepID=UPI003423E529